MEEADPIYIGDRVAIKTDPERGRTGKVVGVYAGPFAFLQSDLAIARIMDETGSVFERYFCRLKQLSCDLDTHTRLRSGELATVKNRIGVPEYPTPAGGHYVLGVFRDGDGVVYKIPRDWDNNPFIDQEEINATNAKKIGSEEVDYEKVFGDQAGSQPDKASV